MEDFSKIETLENAVKWHYFKSVLVWPLEKIAYEMDHHPKRLAEWTNIRASAITALLKAEPKKAEKIREKLEKIYPPPPNETKKERIFREKVEKLDPTRVAEDYVKDPSLENLIKKYKVRPSDFRQWWSRNIGVIDQKVRQIRSRA